ncbi:hypothetical protein CR513_36390, partial [Mucuna pruriens]
MGMAPSLSVFFWFFSLRKTVKVGWTSLSSRSKCKTASFGLPVATQDPTFWPATRESPSFLSTRPHNWLSQSRSPEKIWKMEG